MSVRPIGHRDALLEAAVECLHTVGYARTTARAVVEASGTNLGSIAYHFGSIEQLRDAALIEAATRWLSPIVAAAQASDSTSDRLDRALRGFLASLETQRPLAVAFVEALAQMDRKPALRQRLATAYDELRAAISPDATATVVIALFDGLMLQWMIDPERFRDGGGAVVDELIRALGRVP